MKIKILILGSLVVILLFGFLYMQSNNLVADDKDGKKNCSSKCTDKTGSSSSTENKSQCTEKSSMSDANSTGSANGYAVYEFVTDKIHCDGCKGGMTEKLMGIAGVKEINFGETCKVSQMTSVKVFYSSTDATPEVIAASVKEKGLECDKSKCGDGTKSETLNKTEKKL